MPMPKCQLEGGSPGYIFQLAGLVQTQVTCNAPPLGREGSQRVRIGYPVGMRRRLTGPSQIVVLALIAVLLQTVLISPNCLAATIHTRASIGIGTDLSNGPSRDACCCSLCFCCHCTAVVRSTDMSISVLETALLPPGGTPFLLQPSICPSERPPQV